jgi:CspA family cold shock protein
MLTGKVKMWNASKGFGFLTPDAGGNDIFVHISRCCDGIEELREGQRVQFVERSSRRKPGTYEAADVRVI